MHGKCEMKKEGIPFERKREAEKTQKNMLNEVFETLNRSVIQWAMCQTFNRKTANRVLHMRPLINCSHRLCWSFRVPLFELFPVHRDVGPEFRANAMLENGLVEGVYGVINHVVDVGGHDEVSDCDLVSSDKLAIAASQDTFDHFGVVGDDSLETFKLLVLFLRLGTHSTNHGTQDVRVGLGDLVDQTGLLPILRVIVTIADAEGAEC